MLDQLVVFHLLQQLLISVDCEPATRALYDEDLTFSVAYLSILFMSMSVYVGSIRCTHICSGCTLAE